MAGTCFIENNPIKIISTEKEVDESLFQLAWNMKRLLKENDELIAENKSLKSEQYKDAELTKLKSEIDRLRKILNQSFTVNEREKESIEKWYNEHKNKMHNGRDFNYVFEFAPTAIATFGDCICTTCRTKARRKGTINDNNTLKIQPDIINNYLKESDGDFQFKID